MRLFAEHLTYQSEHRPAATHLRPAAREAHMSAVSVPERLRNPHPLVEATRRFYERVKPDEDGRMRPGPKEGVAHLIVSRPALGRALRVLQAICLEAERRGYAVTPSRGFESTGISILIGEHTYPFGLHELHDRVPVTEDDLARWRKKKEWRLRWEPNLKPPTQKSVPNGYLKLLSPTWHGGRSSWSEDHVGQLTANSHTSSKNSNGVWSQTAGGRKSGDSKRSSANGSGRNYFVNANSRRCERRTPNASDLNFGTGGLPKTHVPTR
jgi:hypothetical protein